VKHPTEVVFEKVLINSLHPCSPGLIQAHIVNAHTSVEDCIIEIDETMGSFYFLQ